MRITLLAASLLLSACSVTGVTERNSGTGISNISAVPDPQAGQPAVQGDYRAKLFEEIG